MKDNIRYSYFRMKADFFDENEIFEMEQVPEVGNDLIITLLKIYCVAVRGKGVIKIPINEQLRKPFEDKNQVVVDFLAKRCRVSFSMMAGCLTYYLQHGLITIEDDQEQNCRNISVQYVLNNTGTGSLDGDRKRLERQRTENKELKCLEYSGAGIYLPDSQYNDLKDKYKEELESYLEKYSYYKKFNNIPDENDQAELIKFINKLECKYG